MRFNPAMPTIINMDELIPAAEARTRLNVSRATENKWHRTGVLNVIRFGRATFYRRDDIEALAAERAAGGGQLKHPRIR